jgi:hypothetical protein
VDRTLELARTVMIAFLLLWITFLQGQQGLVLMAGQQIRMPPPTR